MYKGGGKKTVEIRGATKNNIFRYYQLKRRV